MVEINIDLTGVKPWTGYLLREEIGAMDDRVAEAEKKIAGSKKLIEQSEKRLKEARDQWKPTGSVRRELRAAKAELDENKIALDAAKRHKLDAAIAFAEREWHKEIDESEWGYQDPHTAFRLAATDREYYDAVNKWAQANAADLTPEWKAFLFDILIQDRPSGHEKSVKQRQRARLRRIARMLEDEYGYGRTQNAATREWDPNSTTAATILVGIGITGDDGKPLKVRTIEGLLTKKLKRKSRS